MGVAAIAFLEAGATSLVFTGAAFGVTATGWRALLDLDAGAALGVFDVAVALDLTGDLAVVLTGVLAATLAAAWPVVLADFASLAATFGAATALAFALGAITLAAAFLVEVFTSCLLAV